MASAAVSQTEKAAAGARRARAVAKARENAAKNNSAPVLSPEDQAVVDNAFARFDKDSNKMLQMSELREFMKYLNDGISPTDQEVHFVMEQADADLTGTISAAEIKKVVTVWYLSCEANQKSKGCTIL
eukprot:jgi/Mesvir1/20906/Mv07980-RA.1